MQFLVIGLVGGVLSGLFGIGGGIVIVPSLMLFAGMAPAVATGTSLGALLLPVGILGVWQYYSHGYLAVRPALWIALGLAIGVLLGAQIALRLPARDLQRAFAVFLVFAAARLWWTA